MHHPRLDLDSLRTPTLDEPLRVLISACLVGRPVGWEGGPYTADHVVALSRLPLVHALAACPEDPVLGTPRPLTVLHGGDGFDVLAGRARVLDSDGRDRTAELVRGAEAVLRLAVERRAELAILMNVSDSCGTHVIYDGAAGPGHYRRGPGVAAALLMRAGIPCVAQRDELTLARLRARLDPGYGLPDGLADFREHPWYVESFGS